MHTFQFISKFFIGAVSGEVAIQDEYPIIPLIPFEFNCYYGSRDTLWNCRRSIANCSSGPYRYTYVTCQG